MNGSAEVGEWRQGRSRQEALDDSGSMPCHYPGPQRRLAFRSFNLPSNYCAAVRRFIRLGLQLMRGGLMPADTKRQRTSTLSWGRAFPQ